MKTQKRRALGILLAVGLVMSSGVLFAEEDGMRATYRVGEGLKIGDGNNLVGIQGRVQGRFTWNGLEAATNTDGFTVQRGKIKIEGHTLEKKIKFGFQMNLATRNRATTTAGTNAITAESTTGLAVLEDYYVDWIATKPFGIKVGQFKVPFLMQELTSSGKQQFVDRALSSGFFNLGRDIGVSLHGDVTEGGVNYAVFFMNGDGVNTINRNKGLMVGTRLEVPILGEYKTSESDTDNSQDHNLGFGIAYAYNEAVGTLQNGTIAAFTKASHGTIDLGYKYKGFSLQTAGMAGRTHEGTTLTNYGYNVQTGYFIVPKKIEVAAKTNGSIFDGAAVNQYEHSLGLNYFIAGHGIKLQSDYTLLMNNRGLNLNDHRFRTQLQLIF